VSDAQVSEGEKGLAAGGQPSPAGVDGPAVAPQLICKEAEGGTDTSTPDG
jgi:hypothetical protein